MVLTSRGVDLFLVYSWIFFLATLLLVMIAMGAEPIPIHRFLIVSFCGQNYLLHTDSPDVATAFVSHILLSPSVLMVPLQRFNSPCETHFISVMSPHVLCLHISSGHRNVGVAKFFKPRSRIIRKDVEIPSSDVK